MSSEQQMSLEEAQSILGLKPGETVENYEEAFDEVRRHMERLRDEAPTPEKRAGYERELSRFLEALDVIKGKPKAIVPVKAEEPAKKAEEEMELVGAKKGGSRGWVVMIALLALVAAGAGLFWMKENAARIAVENDWLEKGERALKARNWTEAEQAFNHILAVSSSSEKAKDGLERVAEGREIEKKQQVGFLLGRGQALMELRRWEEAEKAIAEAIAMDPGDPQLVALQERMAEGRRVDEIEGLVEEVEIVKREENWSRVVEIVEELEEVAPDHEKMSDLRQVREEAELVLSGLRQQADGLYQQALSLDTGEYSESALELLREAQRLAPSEKAAALYQKMISYVQTVKVPGDAETIAEALTRVRAGDKVIISEGVYREQLNLPSGVVLEAEESQKVTLEGASDGGSVLSVTSREKPVRLVGLVLRHYGVSNAGERYPVVLAQAGTLVLEDCVVGFGSGHGVAVIDGGEVEFVGTEVRANGWDGIAVTGEGSKAILRESRVSANLHHGLDVWGGGTAEVERSRFFDNGLVGILLSGEGAPSRVESCTVERNRELGICVSNGKVASLERNLVSTNQLGGVFARDKGTRIRLVGNELKANGEAGLVVGKDVVIERDEENVVAENQGRQKWLAIDLEEIAASLKENEKP
ncbi:MAG: right-handed parallel beta-helix repeat-containing protein, partial [Verrucomicrobiota bacterium]